MHHYRIVRSNLVEQNERLATVDQIVIRDDFQLVNLLRCSQKILVVLRAYVVTQG